MISKKGSFTASPTSRRTDTGEHAVSVISIFPEEGTV
jgi:hypothetical protein